MRVYREEPLFLKIRRRADEFSNFIHVRIPQGHYKIAAPLQHRLICKDATITPECNASQLYPNGFVNEADNGQIYILKELTSSLSQVVSYLPYTLPIQNVETYFDFNLQYGLLMDNRTWSHPHPLATNDPVRPDVQRVGRLPSLTASANTYDVPLLPIPVDGRAARANVSVTTSFDESTPSALNNNLINALIVRLFVPFDDVPTDTINLTPADDHYVADLRPRPTDTIPAHVDTYLFTSDEIFHFRDNVQMIEITVNSSNVPNQTTILESNSFEENTPVFYKRLTGSLTGLTDNTMYFVTNPTATSFQLK